MRVITNVTLRVKAGGEYSPPNSAIDLPDRTATDLLAKGHVRRPAAPPEPEAGEGGDDKPNAVKTSGARGGAS